MSAGGVVQVLLRKCRGISGKHNDVLFTGCPGPVHGNAIYFGGDLQDLEEYMASHHEGRDFIEWNLEATARLLHQRLSSSTVNTHVWVIRPSKWISRVLASYANFVDVDLQGNPVFDVKRSPNFHILEYLFSLLATAVERLQTECSSINPRLEQTPIDLIGFSKGCGVLTGFIYQLAHIVPYSNGSCTTLTVPVDVVRLLSNLRSMYWLDAGHSAIEHQWPTSETSLALLNRTQCPVLHAYATPYQVMNPARPWKSRDYNTFVQLLSKYDLPHRHSVLFADTKKKQVDLQMHFSILKHFPI